MKKIKHFQITSSLVLLVISFGVQTSYAQVPKLLQKYEQKSNQIQSGYIKMQMMRLNNEGKLEIELWQNDFFICTHRDLKYLCYHYNPFRQDTDIRCKSAYTIAAYAYRRNCHHYLYEDNVYDCDTYSDFTYPIGNVWTKNSLFQRISPKKSKKNIRYKIGYPDNDYWSNYILEIEFEKKSFHLIQLEMSYNYLDDNDSIAKAHAKRDILEHQLYEYIHPDILDTISFALEKLKKGYNQRCLVEQREKDSVLMDSVAQSILGKWKTPSLKDMEQDTFFMPDWKFPLVLGDTIYSDSINSQFLLIDMWFINCSYCRNAMQDIAEMDTLYDESLLKKLNLNISDKDTSQMRQLIRTYHLKGETAYSYGQGDVIAKLSKTMGLETCLGYPQLYLIEMKTKKVLWSVCGYRKGFTQEIEEVINLNKWKKQ